MSNTVVFGANSDIGHAIAKRITTQNDYLLLLGRTESSLKKNAEELQILSEKKVKILAADLCENQKHSETWNQILTDLNEVDTVLMAYGILGDENLSQKYFNEAEYILNTNFLSYVSWLTLIGNYFEDRKRGTLIVISSIAGDRGRQSNYIYGASKAGLDTYLSGLRNRLHRSGVRVITVKPGWVDTKMTAKMRRNILWASPDQIARGVASALKGHRDIVYLPWFWFWIMEVVRALPEFIFKRMRL